MSSFPFVSDDSFGLGHPEPDSGPLSTVCEFSRSFSHPESSGWSLPVASTGVCAPVGLGEVLSPARDDNSDDGMVDNSLLIPFTS